jgi:GGDEF domain-containing protein
MTAPTLIPAAGPGASQRLAGGAFWSFLRRTVPGADPVTASVGIAGIGPQETLSAAIDRADRAMYRSKSGGRDAVSVASAPMAVAS